MRLNTDVNDEDVIEEIVADYEFAMKTAKRIDSEMQSYEFTFDLAKHLVAELVKCSDPSEPFKVSDLLPGSTAAPAGPVAFTLMLPGGALERGSLWEDESEARDYVDNRAIPGCKVVPLYSRFTDGAP